MVANGPLNDLQEWRALRDANSDFLGTVRRF
jgi:hypothetical protein